MRHCLLYVKRRHGAHEWQRVQINAGECPRISPAFLAEERENVGEWWYQQEYFCAFLDAESAAFSTIDIESAFGERIETWKL